MQDEEGRKGQGGGTPFEPPLLLKPGIRISSPTHKEEKPHEIEFKKIENEEKRVGGGAAPPFV